MVIYIFFEKIFAKTTKLKFSCEKFKKSNYQLTNLQILAGAILIVNGNNNVNNNTTSTSINVSHINNETTPGDSSSSGSSSSSSSSSSSRHPSGLTDAEIDAYIQRDLNERAANGIYDGYDFQEARSFYENVPPS